MTTAISVSLWASACEAQPVADGLLEPADRGLNSRSLVVAEAFCQPIRPRSAMHIIPAAEASTLLSEDDGLVSL
jgi:hypothetical protein